MAGRNDPELHNGNPIIVIRFRHTPLVVERLKKFLAGNGAEISNARKWKRHHFYSAVVGA
jgi:hypothetical protein